MSDLISTPSQPQSVVSNEAFETLIDLLTSDGVDENPPPLHRSRAHTESNATLRDASGKLDFDKIRLMFATQNHRIPTALEPLGKGENRAQSPAVPNEDSDSDDEQQATVPPTVPSRTDPTSQRPAPGHRRSSTFGNQPLMAIHENGSATKAEEAVPRDQPLSFDELNAALAGAHEEVRSLRQQYDELQALVSKHLGAEKRDQTKPAAGDEKGVPGNDKRRVETQNAGLRAQPGAVVPPTSLLVGVPSEITNLSENEAKRALSTLVRSLSLSPSIIGPMATGAAPLSPSKKLSHSNPTRQHDLASISRAVKFLGTIDELVWRRACAPSGPRTLLPVYSEENVVALLARLELWERAVRRSARA